MNFKKKVIEKLKKILKKCQKKKEKIKNEFGKVLIYLEK